MPDNPLNIDLDSIFAEVTGKKPKKKQQPFLSDTPQISPEQEAMDAGLKAFSLLNSGFEFVEDLRKVKEVEQNQGFFTQPKPNLTELLGTQKPDATGVTPSFLPSGIQEQINELNIPTKDLIEEGYQEQHKPIISKDTDKTDIIEKLPEDIKQTELEQRKLDEPGAVQYLKHYAKGIGNVVTNSIQSVGLFDSLIKKYGSDVVKGFIGGRAEDFAELIGRDFKKEDIDKIAPNGMVLPSLIDAFGNREEWQKDPTKHPLYEFGNAGTQFLENVFDTKDFKRTYGTDLASGFGSLTAFYLTGGAGRLLNLPPKATTMLFGALANGTNGFAEVFKETKDIDKAYLQFLVDAGLGTTEALPIERALGRMFKGGKVGLKKYLANTTIGGGEEFLQETLQQFGGESSKTILSDKDYWKELPRILSDALRSGSIGFLTGGAANVVTTAVGDAMDKRQEQKGKIEPETPANVTNLADLPKPVQSQKMFESLNGDEIWEKLKEEIAQEKTTDDAKTQSREESPELDVKEMEKMGVQPEAKVEEKKTEPVKEKKKPQVLKSFEELATVKKEEKIETDTDLSKKKTDVSRETKVIEKSTGKSKVSKRFNVKEIPVKDFKINAEELQNRSEEYSSDTVDSILKDAEADKFDINKFDPVRYWKNPETGEKFILAGHSRLEAFKRLSKSKKDFRTIPAVELTGKTFEEAKKYALEESNTLNTQEKLTDRAKLYYNKRQSGENETEINKLAREREKSNASYVMELSHLNPKGKVITALNQLNKSNIENKTIIEKAASLIGHARKNYPELSNAHESEIFEYLVQKKYLDKFKNKTDFLGKISNAIDRFDFNASEPLNLENNVRETEYDRQFSEAAANLRSAKRKLDDKRSELIEKQAADKTITNDDIERVIKPLSDDVLFYEREVKNLKLKESSIRSAIKDELDLFAAPETAEEVKEEKNVERGVKKSNGESESQLQEGADKGRNEREGRGKRKPDDNRGRSQEEVSESAEKLKFQKKSALSDEGMIGGEISDLDTTIAEVERIIKKKKETLRNKGDDLEEWQYNQLYEEIPKYEANLKQLLKRRASIDKALQSYTGTPKGELPGQTALFKTKKPAKKVTEEIEEEDIPESKPEDEQIGLFQKKSLANPRNSVYRTELVKRLKKAFPKVEVVEMTSSEMAQYLEAAHGITLMPDRGLGISDLKETSPQSSQRSTKEKSETKPFYKAVNLTLEEAPLGFYGVDGKIYLNLDEATLETPMHEFGHLWNAWARNNAMGLYRTGAKLVVQDRALMEYVRRVYPELSQAELIDEAIATAIGRNGVGLFMEISDAKQRETLIDRFKRWMKALFEQIAAKVKGLTHPASDEAPLSRGELKISKLTPESSLQEFLDAVGGDLLAGKKIDNAQGGVSNEGVKRQVKAFHGSPHEFDKFSTEKIGTGEGAQAFGYGLYFTEVEDIAKYYAKTLGTQRDSIQAHIISIYDSYNGDLEQTKEWFRKALNRENYKIPASERKIVEKFLKDKIKITDLTRRNLYEVTIHEGKQPEDYDWVDWRTEPTKSQLNKLLVEAKKQKNDDLIKIVESARSNLLENFKINEKSKYYLPELKKTFRNIPKTPEDLVMVIENDGAIYRALEKKFPDLIQEDNWAETVSMDVFGILTLGRYDGETLYRSISTALGSDKDASLFLLNAGIDGITYEADQGNVAANNYVVFDENAVTIEKKTKFQKKEIEKREHVNKFYSKMERVAQAKINDGMTPEQVRATLLNNGVKTEEIEWTFLDEFFEGKAKIKKAELLDWIDKNRVQIEEIRKGNLQKQDKEYTIDEVRQLTDGLFRDINADYYTTGRKLTTGRGEIRNAVEYILENLDFVSDVKHFKGFGDYYITRNEKIFESGKYQYSLVQENETTKYKLITGADWQSVVKEIYEEEKRLVDEFLKLNPNTWFKGYSVDDYTELPDLIVEDKEVVEAFTPVAGRYDTSVATNYENYTMPGGENYREILYTAPNLKDASFKGGHFKEKNILAHVRLKDRVDENGNKVLFIEEIQSDWAQEGREKGFPGQESENEFKNIENRRIEINNERVLLHKKLDKLAEEETDDTKFEKQRETLITKFGELKDEEAKLITKVKLMHDQPPSAPFVTGTDSWVNFAAKNILREAAEGGYDKIAWTTGEMQAERYDLGGTVDRIEYQPTKENRFAVQIYLKNGQQYRGLEAHIKPEDLKSYFGNEIAQKIIKGDGELDKSNNFNSRILTGLELELGGEGMKEFYGSVSDTGDIKPAKQGIVGFVFNKLAKKWGAKAGTDEITFNKTGEEYDVYEYPATEYKTVFSLPVTDAMKESVLYEGMPMFQYIGRNADLTDEELGRLRQAERMERLKANMDEIYKKTGWFKGRDGEWRRETTKVRSEKLKKELENEVNEEFKIDAEEFEQRLDNLKFQKDDADKEKKKKKAGDAVPEGKKKKSEQPPSEESDTPLDKGDLTDETTEEPGQKEIPKSGKPKGRSFTEAAEGLNEEEIRKFFEANQQKLVAMSAYYISTKKLKKRGFTKFLNDKMEGVYKFSSAEAGNIYALAKGMKMRGMALRTKVFEPFEQREQEIIENPELAYKPQNVKDLKGKAAEMDDTSLENLTDAELSNYIEGSDNYSTLAGIEMINRKIAKGEDYMPIYEKLAKKGTTLGQLINQYKELKGAVPFGLVDMVNKEVERSGRKLLPPQLTKLEELAKKFLEKVNQLKEAVKNLSENYTDEELKNIETLKRDTAQVQQEFLKYAQALNPGKISDTLVAIMQGNLLTAESLLVNPVGNLALAPLRIGGKVIGNFSEIIRSAFTGKKPELLSPFPDLREYAKGLGKGTKKALKDIVKGSTPDDITKYEAVRMFQPIKAWSQLITGKDLAVDQKTGKVRASDRLNKLLEGTFGASAEAMFRGLGIGDKPFRFAEERMFLSELGRKQGLKGKALKRFIEYPPNDASELALKEGMKAIYAGESRTSNSILNWLNEHGGVIKFLARTNIPYIKTPLNIAKETLDYAFPVIPLFKAGYHYKKGNNREGAVNVGKFVLAMMLHGAAEFLASSGVISGGPEPQKDKKVKGLQYIARPPFAFNLSQLKRVLSGEEGTDWLPEDEIFTYNRIFGIPGVIFAVKADIYKEMKKQGPLTEPEKWLERAWGQVTGTSKFFLDQTFLKGTLAIVNALQDLERAGPEWLESVTNVAFFMPNQFAAINRAGQDFIPDSKGDNLMDQLGNVIKAKTFQTEDLPYLLNIWGQPVKRTPEGRNPWIYNLVDISKFRKLEDDPIAFEIMKLYRETNDKDVVPGVIQDNFTYGNVPIKLTRKQYEKFAGSVGQARRELIEGLYGTPAYKNADLQNKIDLLKFVYDEGMDAGKQRFLAGPLPAKNGIVEPLRDKEGNEVRITVVKPAPKKPEAKDFEYLSDKFQVKRVYRDAGLLDTDGTAYSYTPSDEEKETRTLDIDRVIITLEGGLMMDKAFNMRTVKGRIENLQVMLDDGKITKEFFETQKVAIEQAVVQLKTLQTSDAEDTKNGTGQGRGEKTNDRDKINQILSRNKDKDFVRRILSPDKSPEIKLESGENATHLMAYGEADGKYVVYPTVVMKDGELQKLPDEEAFKFAKDNDEFIEFNREEDAMWFSKNYKKVWLAESAK